MPCPAVTAKAPIKSSFVSTKSAKENESRSSLDFCCLRQCKIASSFEPSVFVTPIASPKDLAGNSPMIPLGLSHFSLINLSRIT